MFDTLCIVGVGLIGGSLGMAAREKKLARRVVGWVRRDEAGREGVELGALDEYTRDLKEAARDADCVFLATPVGRMRELCEELAPFVKPGALITDGGSTKAQIVRECAPLFQDAFFVGGHPMAGSEQTGVKAARADLFEGATWAITGGFGTDVEAMRELWEFAKALGARPLLLSSLEHDRLVALTSHLPHLTASALMHVFTTEANAWEARQLTAGGWRDATRVASGDPTMWRDICLSNASALTEVLDRFISQLQAVRGYIETQNDGAVFDWLDEAARAKGATKADG